MTKVKSGGTVAPIPKPAILRRSINSSTFFAKAEQIPATQLRNNPKTSMDLRPPTATDVSPIAPTMVPPINIPANTAEASMLPFPARSFWSMVDVKVGSERMYERQRISVASLQFARPRGSKIVR